MAATEHSTRNDLDTFVAVDQVERELIWNALDYYREASADEATRATLQTMIDRVSQTFSWMRRDDDARTVESVWPHHPECLCTECDRPRDDGTGYPVYRVED